MFQEIHWALPWRDLTLRFLDHVVTVTLSLARCSLSRYNQNVVSVPDFSFSVPEVNGQGQQDDERTVRLALSDIARGIHSATVEKLNRLGDASSVALTKIIASKKLSADDIDHALVVISMSFAAPQAIHEESDRQPRTTLFLLGYLDVLTNDPSLKRKIAACVSVVTR